MNNLKKLFNKGQINNKKFFSNKIKTKIKTNILKFANFSLICGGIGASIGFSTMLMSEITEHSFDDPLMLCYKPCVGIVNGGICGIVAPTAVIVLIPTISVLAYCKYTNE